MPAKRSFSIFYRMGIAAERELLDSGRDLYDGIVISAYFAAFYRSSSPVILRTLNKPFFFDPATYAFARDIENIRRDGRLRKSFQKLVDYYGGDFKSILAIRQLIPRDFFSGRQLNTKRISDFVARTLDLQLNILSPPAGIHESLLKYAELAEEEQQTEAKLQPSFLVAPYFSFESIDDPWYEVAVRLAAESRKQHDGRLFVPICFSKELLLARDSFQKIRRDFNGFDGYLLWPSSFNDDRDAYEYLMGLAEFVKALAAEKKPIYFLYGGFYVPLVLRILGIGGGYCRGICYGEAKDVDAPMATGGGAPKRYYYEKTYSKLPESVARAFFSDNPRELCECRVCSLILEQIMKPPREERIPAFFDLLDYTLVRRHFMENHAKQIEYVETLSSKQILEMLVDQIEKTRNFTPYNVSNMHVARWLTALQELSHQ